MLGMVELHGKDKLSWTKLTSTVPKTDTSQLFSFNHRVNRTNNVRNGGVKLGGQTIMDQGKKYCHKDRHESTIQL